MSTLRYNLRLAEYAVHHVRAIMGEGIGPANRKEFVVRKMLREQLLPPLPPAPGPQPAFDTFSPIASYKVQREWSGKAEARGNVIARREQLIEAESKSRATALEQQRKELAVFSKPLGDPTSRALERTFAAIQMDIMIENTKFGNCGEQSCVAFKYLIARGATNVAVVDWKSANHTFVVVGMEAYVPETSQGSNNVAPDWGPDAVVCDPWYHEWFAVQ
jgi:hypothetical protein